jgi:hypothetical protein
MNHESSASELPLPEMVEGWLDDSMLQQMIDDLKHHAQVCVVRCKGNAARYADPDLTDLETAIVQMQRGLCRAVQIEYRYQKHDWTDTLFVTSGGYRLVRCRHADPAGADEHDERSSV